MNNKQFNQSSQISYEYDTEYVRQITGISASEEDRLIKFFFRMGTKARIEAFKLEQDFYRKNISKKRKDKHNEYVYAMFLLALKSMYKIELQLKIKKALTMEEASKITQIRIERIKAKKRIKKSKKREWIEHYLPLLKQLREAGLSWRDIALYIKKYHRIKIAPSYLVTVYKGLTEEKEEA